MATWTLQDPGVRDYQYRQRVRRFRPSSLLPLVAATTARYWEPGTWQNSPYRKYTPWALADVARVSLAYGTEFGRADAAERDLLQILNAYSRFMDPSLKRQDVREFMLRMAGEQLTWQSSPYEGHARTAAIFAQTPPTQPMECLTPGWDTELLGSGLSDYVGTTQLIWACVNLSAGRFDLSMFDTPDGQRFAQHIGRDTVARIADRHFAISPERFRDEEKKAAKRAGPDETLRRFTYNPLRGRPLLTGFGEGYLCPAAQLAWDKATPWGVYFTGLDHYGGMFTRDLGHLFEQYIGRQLRLLPDAEAVLPEIPYASKDGTRKTVDWIVVLPEVVLLVEVKSAIPAEPVRLGTIEGVDAILKKLGKAYGQIDTTAKLIADHAPELAHVPTDRPALGLVVTLEPYHVANAFSLLPAIGTPVTVTDAATVEALVTITDTPVGRILLDRAADRERSTWSLDTALTGHALNHNPVLDNAWSTYPWASVMRAGR